MTLSADTASSIISFLLLAVAFLISIGLGGSVSAHLKLLIGDRLAVIEGYGSPNPFAHVGFFEIIIFCIFRIMWREPQPFDWDWSPGFRGYIERVVYLLGAAFFHIFLAAIGLFLGILFWKAKFFNLIVLFPSIPTGSVVHFFQTTMIPASSFSIVSALLLGHIVIANIILFLLELLNKTTKYIFMTYISPSRRDDIWFQLASLALILLLFIMFEDVLWMTAWHLISRPVIFCANLIGAL